jgi:hypothetical protein
MSNVIDFTKHIQFKPYIFVRRSVGDLSITAKIQKSNKGTYKYSATCNTRKEHRDNTLSSLLYDDADLWYAFMLSRLLPKMDVLRTYVTKPMLVCRSDKDNNSLAIYAPVRPYVEGGPIIQPLSEDIPSYRNFTDEEAMHIDEVMTKVVLRVRECLYPKKEGALWEYSASPPLQTLQKSILLLQPSCLW